MQTIHSICVCGAGTMGSGIAQVAATAGFRTILFDLNEDVLHLAKASIEKGLQYLVHKNKISNEQQQQILGQVLYTNNIGDCRADMVIEAIVENIDIKSKLFRQLADINDTACIFATNTSSLPVTAIAENITLPERVIGLHFFNPAPVMKLVEIVSTKYTSDKLTGLVTQVVHQMKKTAVLCKDSPGFIVNRVARPFYIESLRLAEEGVDFETIDTLVEAGGFKMGPFRLMDLIGNDVNYAVSCSVYEQLQQAERLKPSFIQQEKVKQGALGKKSGKGYYTYN